MGGVIWASRLRDTFFITQSHSENPQRFCFRYESMAFNRRRDRRTTLIASEQNIAYRKNIPRSDRLYHPVPLFGICTRPCIIKNRETLGAVPNDVSEMMQISLRAVRSPRHNT